MRPKTMSLESSEPPAKDVDCDVRPLPQCFFSSVGKLLSQVEQFRSHVNRCRCCGLDFHAVNVAHNGIDVAPDFFLDFRNLLFAGH
jgi:hypothetical protein